MKRSRPRFGVGVCLAMLLTLAAAAFGGQRGVHHSKDPVAGEYLVSLRPKMDTEAVAKDIAKFYDGMLIRVWTPLNAFAIALDDPAMAESLAMDPRVAVVEENQYLASSGIAVQKTHQDPVCNDTLPDTDCEGPSYQTTDNRFWYLDRIDQDSPELDGTYTYCATGKDINVYVIDYGVQRDHWEFGSTPEERLARVDNGYDATHAPGRSGTEGEAANPCNGFFPREWSVGFDSENFDSFNLAHGTTVGSLVNGKHSGVAKEAKVVPVRIRPCPLPRQNKTPYTVGQLVYVGPLPTGGFHLARVVKAGVTSNAYAFPQDGTVIWEEASAEKPTRGQTLWMIDGICWIRSRVLETGMKARAVATTSAFGPRDLSWQPQPNYACGADSDPTEDRFRVPILQAAVELLAKEIPFIASANNQGSDACATSPADRGPLPGVITVGGTMLVNHRDGDLEAGLRGQNPGAAPQPNVPARDARWVCGAGDTTQCPDNAGSNSGRCVSLFAPARNISGAINTGAFDHRDPLTGFNASGTSYAAPIVAGVVARMLSMPGAADKLKTPADVENALLNTALENMLDPSSLQGSAPENAPNLLLRASDVVFIAQPKDDENPANGIASLSVEVLAAGPIVSYQWYEGANRNDMSQPVGGNSSTLRINPVTHSAYYWVLVKAECDAGGVTFTNRSRVAHVGMPTSNSAALTFGSGSSTPTADPDLATPETPTVTLHAPPVTGNPTYTWYRGVRGDTTTAVATGANPTIVPTASARYWVRIAASGSPSTFIDSDNVTVGVLEADPATSAADRAIVEACTPAPQDVAQRLTVANDGTLTINDVPGASYEWYEGPSRVNPRQLGFGDNNLLRPTDPPKNGVGRRMATTSVPHWNPYEPGSATNYGRSRDRVFWVRISKNGCFSDSVPAVVHPDNHHYGTLLPLAGVKPSFLLSTPDDSVLTVAGVQPLSHFQWYYAMNDGSTIPIGQTDYSNFNSNTVADLSDGNNEHRYWLNVNALPHPLRSDRFRVRVFTWDLSESTSLSAETCVIRLSTSEIVAPPAGGRYTIVVTGGSCAWTADASQSFITIQSGAGPSTGNGQVTFEVTPNNTGADRTGVVRIGGSDVRVSQPVSACPVLLPGSVGNYPPDGGVAQVFVNVASNCQWTARIEPGSFVHLLDRNKNEVFAYTASGSAPVTLRIDPNPGSTTRSATMFIGNAIFIVVQYRNNNPVLSPCPPRIVMQPRSPMVVPERDNVVLSVAAFGTNNTYQWYSRDSSGIEHALDGRTGPQLFLRPGPLPDNGYPTSSAETKYFVRVTRAGCSANSDHADSIDAKVTVSSPPCGDSVPTITTRDPDILWAPGPDARIELEATAAGTPSVDWKWYLGVTGDTSHPLGSGEVGSISTDGQLEHSSVIVSRSVMRVVPNAPEANYWATATWQCRQASRATTRVKVFSPPSDGRRKAVLSKGQSTTVPVGTMATFSIDTPEVNPHFKWYEGVQGVTDKPVGTDSPTLTVTAVTPTSYWVRVSADDVDPNDSETMYLEVCTAPAIVVQPVSASAEAPTGSSTVTLSATVVAQALNATYTWYQGTSVENGVIVGTGPTFSRTYQSTDAVDQPVYYFCHIEDNTSTPAACHGFVNSTVITFRLTHCAPALSSWGPDYVQFTPARPAATISVRAEGQGLTYKWFRGINGQKSELLNYTNPDLTVGENTLTNGNYDAFWCEVTRPGCSTPLVTPKTYAFRWGVCPLPPLTVTPLRATAAISSGAPPPKFTAFIDWPRVSYQWYRGQSGDTRNPIVGATQSTYQSDQVVTSVYWLRVTDLENPSCFVDSPSLVYLVGNCEPVYVTTQPQSVDIPSGGTATLHVDATSAFGVWYDWYEKGTPDRYVDSGSDLTVTGLKESMQYYAVISPNIANPQNCGFSTVPAIVRVRSCAGITISEQPQPVSVLEPGAITADLSVVATSSEFISYQWYRGASGDTSDPIDGATASTVHITQPANAEKKTYWVRMKTFSCTVDSDSAVVGCIRPHFVRSMSGNLRKGEWALMEAWAEGDGLQYEWYLDAIGGTPFSTAKAFWIHPDDTAKYVVRVKGNCGTVDSGLIVMSVCEPPVVTQQRPNVFVFPGGRATLTANVYEANHVDVTYQWIDELGNGVVGANSTTLVTPPITAEKKFSLLATAGICTTRSQEATVSLCALPEVIYTGTTQNVAPHQTVILHAAASAYSSDSFAWYLGPAGDTSTPVGNGGYELAVFAPLSGAAEYWAKVTHPDDGCVSHTNTYRLNVCLPRITAQPVSTTANPAQPATLSVTAELATSYQWYIGEKGDITSPVPGGTTATINVNPASDTRYWVRVIGSCGLDERGGPIGPVDSESALVTVCHAPVILQSSPGPWIARGSSFTLGVFAEGTNLTYQWYTGSSGDTTAPIAGATSANYSAAPQNTTSYWVRVSGTCGSVNSATMTVSVCATPSIVTQPQSVSIFSGASTTLSVTASEATTTPISYQWYRGASGDPSFPVGTGPTYTTPALTADTSYWVRVSCGNCTPADSQAAIVTMCTYSQTISAPPNAQIAVGQSTRLTGWGASGANMYMWFRGASGDTSTPLTSWQANNYLDVSPAVTTQYWYRLQNGSCMSSSGTVTVSVCIPTITTQPANVMINSGASATLTVVANTTGLTYQWYAGTSGTTTSPIAGATGASVTVSPVAATNYWVRVTGTCGQWVNSATAAVTICQPPAITQSTPGPWIARGSSFTLGVTATGTNLTYQWYTGASGNTSAPISGANAANHTASPQNTTSYWVRVSGACGSVNSVTMTISVCMAPSITAQPQSVTTFSGSTTTLSVTATQGTTSPTSYQWYRGAAGDTSVPVGTDAATYTTPALTSNTNYWVRVSCGTCAPADSQTATVSICLYSQTLAAPPNVQTAVGESTRLTGVAPSAGNGYQWFRGASGDTSSPLTPGYQSANFVDVAPAVTTQYWYRLQNGACVSSSGTVTVNVCVPQISTQPASVTIPSGSPTTLTVAANLAGVTYQWYTGASGTTTSPISGATSTTLTVSPAAATTYWARATSTCGRTVDSAAATVSVCQIPTITRQPLNAAPVNGGQTSYTDVIAAGSNLTYQWYEGESGDMSMPITCGPRDSCTGSTTSSFSILVYTSKRVWVRISGMCGSVNSNATWLSVYPAIMSQPASASASYGSTASFEVGAGGAALHYTWKWANGTLIAGSTDSPRLVLSQVTANVSVFCDVTSGVATRTTTAADVMVCDGPYIISTQVSPAGGNCRMISVNVSNPYNIDNYYWYVGPRGDTSHPQTQFTGYSGVYVCPSSSTTYWCRVTGYDTYQGTACYTDSQAVTVP